MPTMDSPAISESFLPATEHVSCFFEEPDEGLPSFLGRSFTEHVTVMLLLNRKDKHTNFRKAAIAASLHRDGGRRTDLTGAETTIQQFSRKVGIGSAHCARLARTHNVIGELLATGSKKCLPGLLADDELSFKHFYVAANYAVQPVEALLEAREQGWSANELARWLAARKSRTLLDAATDKPVHPDDDDDDLAVDWRGLPERVSQRGRPTNTSAITLLVTETEGRDFRRQVRDLAAVLGTESDIATVLAIVRRAHAEWARAESGDRYEAA